jgi:phage-related protein
MTQQTEWQTLFYTDEKGRKPVEEFLKSLDITTQARFYWSIEQLRVLNRQAREPLVKHIRGKLWELRRASSGNIYRLFYFFYTGREIVFLHGFQKQSDKTPRHEIEIAEKRMKDYIDRKGGDTQ